MNKICYFLFILINKYLLSTYYCQAVLSALLNIF